MKRARLLLLPLIFICSSAFAAMTATEKHSLEELDKRITISQGIAGQVMFWQGDFMPMVGDGDGLAGKKTLVSRKLYIYPAIKESDVVAEAKLGAPFYSQIKSTPIKIIRSGRDGFFQTSLPPGTYSIFVQEGDDFYANGFDSAGYIYPIKVNQGEVTKFQFDITYKATY